MSGCVGRDLMRNCHIDKTELNDEKLEAREIKLVDVFAFNEFHIDISD